MATEEITTHHPSVAGRCPACGSAGSLFLGSGGYVTCSIADCPDPGKASDLLNRPTYHVVDVGENGWAVQHEATCFPDLLGCEVHRRIEKLMRMFDTPPVASGRYRWTDSGQLAPLAGLPPRRGAQEDRYSGSCEPE